MKITVVGGERSGVVNHESNTVILRKEKMIEALPVNPKLPEEFFSTANEDRSEEEIKTWWDRPFAQQEVDGPFVVRCLDGGAWDRPTFYGSAATIEEATALANQKLAAWQTMRAEPRVMFDEGSVNVVRMRQKPGDEIEVLGTFDDAAAAQKFMADLP